MATAGTPGGVGEASAEDYAAYSTIVDAVSAGIAEGIKDALDKLQAPTGLTEMMAEQAESAPAQEEVERLYSGFWNVARGLQCNLDWQSVTGVPKKSALNSFTVVPATPSESAPGQGYSSGASGESGEGQQEWGFNINAFGVGIGMNF